jgi:hypothetical protein
VQDSAEFSYILVDLANTYRLGCLRASVSNTGTGITTGKVPGLDQWP